MGYPKLPIQALKKNNSMKNHEINHLHIMNPHITHTSYFDNIPRTYHIASQKKVVQALPQQGTNNSIGKSRNGWQMGIPNSCILILPNKGQHAPPSILPGLGWHPQEWIQHRQDLMADDVHHPWFLNAVGPSMFMVANNEDKIVSFTRISDKTT